jgi:transposase InsO family protein
LFIDNVFANHGLPQKIISNRGSTFMSHFTQSL